MPGRSPLYAFDPEDVGRTEQRAWANYYYRRWLPLFDDMLLVLFGHLDLVHLDELDDPARIKINHETDSAAILRQMFDGEPQATWPGWS